MTDLVEKSVNTAKAAVSEKLEDGKVAAERLSKAAERLLRRSRHAVQGGVKEAVHQVKRNAVAAVAIGFVAGAVVGFVLPRLGRRT